ncbi:MAG: YdcH family protein [Roseibacillus sp.]
MQKHDLLHEFPEHKERIHELKVGDNHFRRLFDQYHEINDEIHRIETGAENTEDEVLNGLRRERLHLKDELLTMITAKA